MNSRKTLIVYELSDCLNWEVKPRIISQRIIWVERDLQNHLVQLPCHEQGYSHLDLVAQSPIQPDSQCLQGRGIAMFRNPNVHCFPLSASARQVPQHVVNFQYRPDASFYFFTTSKCFLDPETVPVLCKKKLTFLSGLREESQVWNSGTQDQTSSSHFLITPA